MLLLSQPPPVLHLPCNGWKIFLLFIFSYLFSNNKIKKINNVKGSIGGLSHFDFC
jgi:hypothetical protein